MATNETVDWVRSLETQELVATLDLKYGCGWHVGACWDLDLPLLNFVSDFGPLQIDLTRPKPSSDALCKTAAKSTLEEPVSMRDLGNGVRQRVPQK